MPRKLKVKVRRRRQHIGTGLYNGHIMLLIVVRSDLTNARRLRRGERKMLEAKLLHQPVDMGDVNSVQPLFEVKDQIVGQRRRISSRHEDKSVGLASPKQLIGAGRSDQSIAAATPHQHIVAAKSVDDVVAAAPAQIVVLLIAGDILGMIRPYNIVEISDGVRLTSWNEPPMVPNTDTFPLLPFIPKLMLNCSF